MNIIIFQILGIVFVVMGFSLVVNRKGLPALILEASDHDGLWFLYGCIALLNGAVLLAFNHAWNSFLVSVISVLGWLALFKGTFILVFPKSSGIFYKKICRTAVVASAGFVIFVFGLVFLYKGFM